MDSLILVESPEFCCQHYHKGQEKFAADWGRTQTVLYTRQYILSTKPAAKRVFHPKVFCAEWSIMSSHIMSFYCLEVWPMGNDHVPHPSSFLYKPVGLGWCCGLEDGQYVAQYRTDSPFSSPIPPDRTMCKMHIIHLEKFLNQSAGREREKSSVSGILIVPLLFYVSYSFRSEKLFRVVSER